MDTVGVLTNIRIKHLIIPQRIQGLAINSYALQKKLKINYFLNDVSQFSDNFSTLITASKNRKIKTMIFTSVLQLPYEAKSIKKFQKNFSKINIHFCLESHSGTVKNILKDIIAERAFFLKTKNYMDIFKTPSYKKLIKFYQKSF